MKDQSGTNLELLKEISLLTQKIKQLEQSQSEFERAKKSLQESEATVRAIVDNAPFGVQLYNLDSEKRLIFIGSNLAADSILKMSSRQFVGKTLEEAFPFFSPTPIPYAYRRVAATGERYDAEQVDYDNGGVSGTFEVHALQIGPNRMVAFFRDITGRKKAEEQLRQKTALLEAQVNASPDGILIIDGSRRILQNHRVNDLLKLPKNIAEDDSVDVLVEWVKSMVRNPEEYMDKRSYRIAHPDAIIHSELEFKDGTVLERYSGPVSGEDGKHYGTIIMYRDITERKKSEEALRISQTRLAEAMELANIVYWEADPADNTYILNDSFYAFYGTTAEKEGGYRMTREEYYKRFVHPDDIPLHCKFVADNTLRPDTEFFADLEHRIIRRDGTVRHILARARVIKDESGRVIRRYGANQDITQRKQSEEEKAHLESQLLQSRKMEAIGTLAGGIAHDFNNILTVINGFGSMLQMDIPEDDPKRTYIDQILASSEKAAQLTRGLLAFSRKQQISLKLLDINNTIRATSKLLTTLLTEDIELKIKLSEETPIVMADASQMDQILFNLAANARDAMPQGGLLF